LGSRSELRQSLAVLAAANELGDLTGELVLALTHRLNHRLALTTKFVNAYDSRPAEGTERADYTLTTQVGFAFGQ
jgi:putative salt-induced outer membrane protein YdiY